MATVRILRSTTASATPSALVSGQIAINETDGKLFYRNGSGAVAQFSPPATIADGYAYDCGSYSSVTSSAPTAVVGTAGNAQVVLTWGAPVLPGGAAITDYSIQYSSNSGSSWTSFSHTASTALTATVTGLTNSTAYLFRVAAITSAGTGSYAQSSSVTPTSGGGGATFSSASAAWTSLFTSGSGTSASPYTRTGAYATNFAGAYATVVSNGTVRVTGNMYSDFGVDVFRNGSTSTGYTIADSNGGNGASYTLNGTITVNSGDVIRIGTSGTDGYVLNAGQTLNIWWQ